MNAITLLSRTPGPLAGESLRNYVLRISECNGYETPSHVLAAAGYQQSVSRFVGLDLGPLAGVLARDPSELSPHRYRQTANGGAFLLLGNEIKARMLGLHRPRFCPLCVAQHGYVHAYWDLQQMKVCPAHGVEGLVACQQCGKDLHWLRPGLLRCRCGACLSEAPLPQASAPSLWLARVIFHKIGAVGVWTDLRSRGPKELGDMTLCEVLRLIELLATLSNPSASRRADVVRSDWMVEPAAQVLWNWPTGFHDLLSKIDATDEAARARTFAGARFSKLKNAIGHDQSFGFLMPELVRFGSTIWGEGIVHPRMLTRYGIDPRYVSLSEVARRSGIARPTLAKWLRDGHLQAKTVGEGAQKKHVVDASAFVIPQSALGDVLDERQAAKRLGLPSGVLPALKAEGHLVPKYRARLKGGYHEQDVEAFERKLEAFCGHLPEVQGNSVDRTRTLLHLLRWGKFGGGMEAKNRFLVDYLNGRILATAKVAATPWNVVFTREAVHEFITTSRTSVWGHYVSRQDAILQLACSRPALDDLIALGHLDQVDSIRGRRITATSLERFLERYVGLRELASQWGGYATPAQLTMVCNRLGLEIVRTPVGEKSYSPFLPRDNVGLLSRAWQEKMSRREAKRGLDSLGLVKEYLASLKSRRLPLPRFRAKGGFNLTSVAKGAGICRKTLRETRELIDLVKQHARDEQAWTA